MPTTISGDTGVDKLNFSQIATGTPSATTFLRGDNTWATPPSGFSGAQTITTATDITLTATSPQTLTITTTVDNVKIILPDATTLSAGAIVYQIFNNGAFSINVVNTNGSGVTVLPAITALSLALTDKSTAAGKWTIINLLAIATRLGPQVVEAFQGGVYVMKNSTFLAFISTNVTETSTDLSVRAGTFNNTTNLVTWGSPATVTLGFAFTLSSVYPDRYVYQFIDDANNGQVLIGGQYASGSTNRAVLRAILVSGTTVSFGSEFTAQTGPAATGASTWLCGTSFGNGNFYLWTAGRASNGTLSNIQNRLVTVDVSGNISAGSSFSSLQLNDRLATLDTNLVLIQDAGGTGTRVASLSGGTVTLSSPVLGGSSFGAYKVIKISSTMYRVNDAVATLSGTNLSTFTNSTGVTNSFRGNNVFGDKVVGVRETTDYPFSATLIRSDGSFLGAISTNNVVNGLTNANGGNGSLQSFKVNATKAVQTNDYPNSTGNLVRYAIYEVNA